jgi:hypothetical protein
MNKPLANRLDRLSRAAHRFHRFAHHPLCERYSGEVVRIGRRARSARLCRGCVYAVIGGSIGGAIGFAIADARVAIASTVVAVIALLVSLRWRPTKIVTRFVPALLLACAIVAGVAARSPVGLVAAFAAAASAGGLRLAYGKRGADRSPCVTCPERERQPCAGFVAIISRERAFQRVAGAMIMRSGAAPSRRSRPAQQPR